MSATPTIRIAPADFRRVIQEASTAGWLSSALSRKISEPYSVGNSRDWIMSFAPKGMPKSGQTGAPARPVPRIWSAAAAASVSSSEAPRCAQAPTTESVHQHNRAHYNCVAQSMELNRKWYLIRLGPLENTVCLRRVRDGTTPMSTTSTTSYHDLRSAEGTRTPRPRYLLRPSFLTP